MPDDATGDLRGESIRKALAELEPIAARRLVNNRIVLETLYDAAHAAGIRRISGAGGKKRAASLTPEQRSEIARKARQASRGRKKQGNEQEGTGS